jgi:6-phosphogluconolactonase
LVHLGIGPDGHVASLFPQTDLDSHRLVLVTMPTKGLDPQVGRVSLSLGLITSAREVVLVATGSGKAGAVYDALSATSDLPAARVLRGEATLILDRDAGKFLDMPGAR